MRIFNVLVACEESQTSCIAFRNLGCNAFSCDIQPCSGGHPEWHIQSDVLSLINGNCNFITQNGDYVTVKKWDLILDMYNAIAKQFVDFLNYEQA